MSAGSPTVLQRIGVVGGGAWGTALALAAARAGRDVTLWMRDAECADAMARTRATARSLPGLALPASVQPTADLARLAAMDALLVVIPTQAMRTVLEALTLVVTRPIPVVACSKGIERATGLFVTDIINDCLPANAAGILSGPSFATDVAGGLPTAVTLACRDEALAQALGSALGSAAFRIYHSSDVRGVEIGGAAKNVLAIAAGMVVGRGLGESARAALVTRGFAELRRFGQAYGARADTLMGLAGLGDLLLTCASAQSRNFSLGLHIGSGQPIADLTQGASLAEGAQTASVLVALAKARAVDMPVAGMVDAVLKGWVTVDGAAEALISRPQRAE
jgi:glycerol-3-phosphate dehydrogenase (NAD(P)+)